MTEAKILVTGANGQLGQELGRLAADFPGLNLVLASRAELAVDNEAAVTAFFEQHQPDYCINCAAYTAVDRAESEQEAAFRANALAPEYLANACRQHTARLLHISTDYVFNGQSPIPYTETSATDPINIYGATKREGELRCLKAHPESIVLRTAWVYSEYGSNFVKTMLRLMHTRDTLTVVNDQIGAPTYAADLAGAILRIIHEQTWIAGIYHYSNAGKISWYDFAVAIRNHAGLSCTVTPISTAQFPTAARRPAFSLLDTTLFKKTFSQEIPDWEDSLKQCLQRLLQQ